MKRTPPQLVLLLVQLSALPSAGRSGVPAVSSFLSPSDSALDEEKEADCRTSRQDERRGSGGRPPPSEQCCPMVTLVGAARQPRSSALPSGAAWLAWLAWLLGGPRRASPHCQTAVAAASCRDRRDRRGKSLRWKHAAARVRRSRSCERRSVDERKRSRGRPGLPLR